MAKKKRKSRKDRITVQKIKEDPVWRKRFEAACQYNLALAYVADTMLKELERVYREVQG